MEDIGGDAAPQQLHDRTGAIPGIDAGTPEFENFAGVGDEPGDVVFRGRVERAAAGRRLAPDQPIGADDAIGAAAPAVIEHEQVIADPVVPVEIAPPRSHFRTRPRGHLRIEDPVTQRLGCINLGR